MAFVLLINGRDDIPNIVGVKECLLCVPCSSLFLEFGLFSIVSSFLELLTLFVFWIYGNEPLSCICDDICFQLRELRDWA